MRDRPPCRRVLIGATLAAAALAGCGFQLRRPPELQLKRVALTGLDAYSPMGEELRRQLRASPGAVVVEAPAQADMVLAVLEDAREQVVVASTAAGQVREFQLRLRFRFKLSTPKGKELIPESEILLQRDISYSESIALSKQEEEAELYRDMQTDVVQQVLRRLAAVRSL